ncbi:MAG: hypothetical protein MJ252_18785 [archaeon]|nr:hypothetical protein [archaeon]
MSTTIVYRIITPAVFSRIEVPSKGTFLDLKLQVEKVTGIKASLQNLFLDQRYTSKITLSDKDPISKLKLREGSPIYLRNSEPEKKAPVLEKKDESLRCNHGENEVCINCMGKKKPKEEKKPSMFEQIQGKSGLTPKCTHGPGQKCLYCMAPADKNQPMKYKCQHGEGGKCPNCAGKEFISDAKHLSFDQYINDKRQKCKGTHEMTTLCINCMPPALLNYKMKPNCPNHPPYPEGVCNKCMPANVILNRQVYRHVDFVSFMNTEEINEFIKPWVEGFYSVQRMAYLFGYYAKDPNYPDGVRLIVEALFEPKQMGDHISVEPMCDDNTEYVDKITEALGLDCVGWIFTSTSEKEVALTSYDIRKAAKYQEEYPYEHSTGCKISRFVTCAVKAKDTGECEIECYMVSDMCQAMERDGLFDNLKDPKKMQVRPAKKNEMLPTVFMENKATTSFDPDFFIVNIAHGAPADKKDQNILKNYDFPVENRQRNGVVTESMIKDYFKRHKKDAPLVKCANLYFLMFLAKSIDMETAKTYAQQISQGFIDWEVLESILGMYTNY